jgi:hypothetical protein
MLITLRLCREIFKIYCAPLSERSTILRSAPAPDGTGAKKGRSARAPGPERGLRSTSLCCISLYNTNIILISTGITIIGNKIVILDKKK